MRRPLRVPGTCRRVPEMKNNQKSNMLMETNKEKYFAPACEVMTLQEEGVICASAPDIEKGNEYEW